MFPIRVLNVVAIMDPGGLETMIMNHYRKIDRNKIQFDFLVHRTENAKFNNEIKELGGKIFNLPKFNPLKINEYKRALDQFFIEHQEYKIIHSHYNALSMWPLQVAMKNNVPIRIAHSHLAYPKFNYQIPFYKYARLKINRYCTTRFACSQNAANWLFGKNQSSNITIFKNAIPSDLFIFNNNIRKEYREKLSLVDKFVVGHVGRFNASKNHAFLMEVFKKIHSKKDNAILILVGDGELKEQMIQKAKQLNIENAIRFLGVRSDVAKILQALDVFVFPSHFEALPVTLVEAQASGLKVFASDIITDEVKISNLVEFISLKQTPDYWADQILKNSYTNHRENMFEKIRLAGYDIYDNTKWLESFYIDEYSKIEN